MKRKVIIGAVIAVLVYICIALNNKILKPSDFEGVWYRAGNGTLYIFEDGLIECADNERIILEDTVFSGAYCFAKDNVVLFVVDDNGVGEVAELFLLHRPSGDVLCERNDSADILWFCRNRNTAVETILK